MNGPFNKKKRSLAVLSVFMSLFGLTIMAAPAPAQAACSALPSSKGTVSMTVSVPSAGTYRVWARELAPTTNANGFYLQIADAGACQVTMGDAVIPVNTWTWADYQNGAASSKVNVTLTAGNHTVVMAGLDDGVEVDKILLLSDTSCTPTGDGSNCTAAAATPAPTPGGGGGGSTPAPTPTPIPLPSPGTSGSTTPITVSKTISIPVPGGASNAQCLIDGKSVSCASVDTTKLSDGNHTVEVKATDANGKPIDQKTTIKVQNQATLKDRVVAGVQKYRLPLIALAALIILIPIGLIAARHFGLFGRPRSNLAYTMPSSPSTPPLPTSPAPSTPPAPVVYPDNNEPPLT
jgi:hypothetical protein